MPSRRPPRASMRLVAPADIAILPGDVAIKADRDKNVCGDHRALRIQAADLAALTRRA